MSGQTSGSISLDTSKIAEDVAAVLAPVLEQINNHLHALAGQGIEHMITVLENNWPAGADLGAADLAQNLMDAGYALVRIEPVAAPVPADMKRAREDEWFAPGREA
jgi:hypothetical protein